MGADLPPQRSRGKRRLSPAGYIKDVITQFVKPGRRSSVSRSPPSPTASSTSASSLSQPEDSREWTERQPANQPLRPPDLTIPALDTSERNSPPTPTPLSVKRSNAMQIGLGQQSDYARASPSEKTQCAKLQINLMQGTAPTTQKTSAGCLKRTDSLERAVKDSRKTCRNCKSTFFAVTGEHKLPSDIGSCFCSRECMWSFSLRIDDVMEDVAARAS
jgi:hypothetical protein